MSDAYAESLRWYPSKDKRLKVRGFFRFTQSRRQDWKERTERKTLEMGKRN